MTDEILQSTMDALGDCYDQVVFLQQAVQQAVRVNDVAGLVSLVRQASAVMGARESGLFLEGRWQTPVPGWLADAPRPERREFQIAGADGHALAVPVSDGWVAFWHKDAAFTAGDARLAETLGDLIGATADAIRARAERLRAEVAASERRLAARVWRRVIPEQPRVPSPYRVTSTLRPARDVGGDFLTSSDDWLVIGDVSGKGVPSAMFTGMFVAALSLAVDHDDPGEALARALHTYLEDSEMFASLIAVRLWPDGRLQSLNLGHPPALIRRREGTLERIAASAPPLGTFRLDHYHLEESTLRPGDLLCLYTDGLSEAERPDAAGLELFGQERIEALLLDHADAGGAFAGLVTAVDDWAVTDDLTLALVEYRPEAS